MIYNMPEYWLIKKAEPIGSYLTFSSPSSFTLKTNNGAKNWDGTLEHSTDTTTWTTWDGTTELASSGNVLYLRGTGNTVITGSNSDYKWVLTGSDIVCSGNIETLLDYAAVQAGRHPTMANYCYARMFYECTNITTAPELPATTLAESCYRSMFDGCTSLTTAPALPATTLARACYNYMFYGCTSLITAPALPATTLAPFCYSSMFFGCTSLTTVPALPATTLPEYCYQGMFQNCTSIKLSSTKTGEYTLAYRVPTSGNGTAEKGATSNIFSNTGGTFKGAPPINKTYYLSNTNTIVG